MTAESGKAYHTITQNMKKLMAQNMLTLDVSAPKQYPWLEWKAQKEASRLPTGVGSTGDTVSTPDDIPIEVSSVFSC